MSKKGKGFTRVEFIIAIAIIVFLVIMIIPVLNKVREINSEQLEKTTSTKEIMEGLHNIQRIKVGSNSGINGSFFFGCGSVSGSTYDSVRFWWQDNTNPNIYYSTTLELDDKVIVEIDDSLETPQVEFIEYWKEGLVSGPFHGKRPWNAKIYTPKKYWTIQLQDIEEKL